MKKVLLMFIFLVVVLCKVQSQTTSLNQKGNFMLKPLKLIDTATINIFAYERFSFNVGFGIGTPERKTKGKIPSQNNESTLDFQKANPKWIWRDNMEFSNENFSKLPAVNTYDIIRILDKERILTNW